MNTQLTYSAADFRGFSTAFLERLLAPATSPHQYHSEARESHLRKPYEHAALVRTVLAERAAKGAS